MKIIETLIVGNNMQMKYDLVCLFHQTSTDLSKPVSFRAPYSRIYTYINLLGETRGLASFGGNRLEVTCNFHLHYNNDLKTSRSQNLNAGGIAQAEN